MDQNDKKEITGLWVFRDVDHALEYFNLKAFVEKDLGRVLTGNEAHDLLKGMRDAGSIEGFEVGEEPAKVKEILKRFFKTLKKEDSED